MTSCVNDIVHSSHDVKISVFVDHTGVTGGIVSWGIIQVLCNESFIVAPESKHEGWWQWELDYDFTEGLWFSALVVSFIEDSNIVSWNGSSNGSWESWEYCSEIFKI
jgi:hypothetical protein